MKHLKWLVLATTLGYFFYLFNPMDNYSWTKTGFFFLSDCNAARVWQAAQTPAPSASPAQVQLTVSPNCYQDEGGQQYPQ